MLKRNLSTGVLCLIQDEMTSNLWRHKLSVPISKNVIMPPGTLAGSMTKERNRLEEYGLGVQECTYFSYSSYWPLTCDSTADWSLSQKRHNGRRGTKDAETEGFFTN
jgi:hypothetical protein